MSGWPLCVRKRDGDLDFEDGRLGGSLEMNFLGCKGLCVCLSWDWWEKVGFHNEVALCVAERIVVFLYVLNLYKR